MQCHVESWNLRETLLLVEAGADVSSVAYFRQGRGDSKTHRYFLLAMRGLLVASSRSPMVKVHPNSTLHRTRVKRATLGRTSQSALGERGR